MNIPVPNPNIFAQRPVESDPNSVNTFVGNIAAIQDPSGTLERMQAQQIAKSMADIKTEGINNLYKGHAIKAIQGYQDYSQSLYKSNKGFNRLSLSAQQLLDENSKYKELLLNVNALKDMSSDYNRTLQQAAQDVHSGIITPDAYKEFEKELEAKNKEAASIGELPFAHAIYNNYLAKMPYDWTNMTKDLKAAVDGMKVEKSVTKEGAERYNVAKLDPTPTVNSLFDYNQRFRTFWLTQTKGDEAAARKLALEYGNKFGVDDKTWGGTISSGKDSFEEWMRKADYTAGIKNTTGRQEIPYDSATGWDFSQIIPADRPRFSGAIKDSEGNSVSVKDAEVINAHINPKTGKLVGNLVGEGVPFSGDSKGMKGVIDPSLEVELDEHQIDNSLNKKKYQRTLNGQPYKIVSKAEAAKNAGGIIYIGTNGKEYSESDLAGYDIQKMIKDKKIKLK